MKKMIIWIIIGMFGIGLLASCATPAQRQGTGIGGALGAIAGALIDSDNRWRGAVIGGAVGAALGGTVTEISAQASREAAQTGKPVTYESTDGWQRVESRPVSYDSLTKCHKVRERVWQDDKLVKDEVREVCESDKTENTY